MREGAAIAGRQAGEDPAGDTGEIRPAWAQRLAALSLLLGREEAPVLDADVHLSDPEALTGAMARRHAASPDYFHGRILAPAEALAEMDLAGVDLALVWQNPAATPQGSDLEANAIALRAANEAVHRAARAHPERFVAAGWTDPQALGTAGAKSLARACARDWGMFVIKMNPAQNAYPLDSPMVLEVVETVLEEGAVPAFHIGADTPFTPPEALERVARHVAPRPLIAVHGGGGGASYLEQEGTAAAFRGLLLRLDNLFVIHSAKRDTHMASDILAAASAGPETWRRLALGSDAPYGRMAWNFGGGRALIEQLSDPRHPEQARREAPVGLTSGHVRDYLGGNAARFLGSALAEFTRVQMARRSGAVDG